ncbi:uncharacterized protein SCHCODRAFT_02674002 [Schizophyllum commune H4-8]|uniref:Uncharacterized protein n=1 Tax=Schizophyllum commune (strain H4-8 / FGSC 9210) TaxID=578458 RepID=D8QM75_SCHCM|nr:uncharacterized protein SCHCODRAFT_02674002 [Schizophyllum commune H4-8]KAI5836657.1 hypothetical protein SCHCODRAFT_02674002 [Schizophyllum commune H4-8]
MSPSSVPAHEPKPTVLCPCKRFEADHWRTSLCMFGPDADAKSARKRAKYLLALRTGNDTVDDSMSGLTNDQLRVRYRARQVSLQTELESIRAKLEDLRVDSGKEICRLEAELVVANASATRLMDLAEKLRAHQQALEVTRLRLEDALGAAEKEREGLARSHQDTVDELLLQLDSARKTAKGDLQALAREHQAAVDELRLELATVNSERQDLISEHQRTVEGMRIALEAARGTASSDRQTLVREHQRAVKEMRSELEKAKREREELIRKHQKIVEGLRNDLEIAHETASGDRQELAREHQAAVDELRLELATVNSERQDLISEHQRTVEGMRIALEAARGTASSDRQTLVREHQRAVKEMRSELEEAKREREELIRKHQKIVEGLRNDLETARESAAKEYQARLILLDQLDAMKPPQNEFELYDKRWKRIKAATVPIGALSLDVFPWPVHDFAGEASLTEDAIHSFLLDPKRPGVHDKKPVSILKSEQLKWHPDKSAISLNVLQSEVREEGRRLAVIVSDQRRNQHRNALVVSCLCPAGASDGVACLGRACTSKGLNVEIRTDGDAADTASLPYIVIALMVPRARHATCGRQMPSVGLLDPSPMMSQLPGSEHSACSAARISGVWGFRGAWTIDGRRDEARVAGSDRSAPPSRLLQCLAPSRSLPGSVDASDISQKPRRHAGDAPRPCWRGLASVSHGWPTALEKIRLSRWRQDRVAALPCDQLPCVGRPTASMAARRANEPTSHSITMVSRDRQRVLKSARPRSDLQLALNIRLLFDRLLLRPAGASTITLPNGSDLCNPKINTTSILDFVNDESAAAKLVAESSSSHDAAGGRENGGRHQAESTLPLRETAIGGWGEEAYDPTLTAMHLAGGPGEPPAVGGERLPHAALLFAAAADMEVLLAPARLIGRDNHNLLVHLHLPVLLLLTRLLSRPANLQHPLTTDWRRLEELFRLDSTASVLIGPVRPRTLDIVAPLITDLLRDRVKASRKCFKLGSSDLVFAHTVIRIAGELRETGLRTGDADILWYQPHEAHTHLCLGCASRAWVPLDNIGQFLLRMRGAWLFSLPTAAVKFPGPPFADPYTSEALFSCIDYLGAAVAMPVWCAVFCSLGV